MDRIEKPFSLIVSGGRTGTAFCGKKLNHIIKNCEAFHEPDTIHQARPLNDAWFVLLNFGLYEGVIRKVLGRSGVRNLSRRFLSSDLSHREAAKELLSQRRKFIERSQKDLFVEANYGYYGLLPVLPDVFASYRVAAVVRDPVTWVASYLRKNDRYGDYDLIDRLGLRIGPWHVGDEETAKVWGTMRPEEKLGWFWSLVYGLIDDFASVDPGVKVFRYEDLFSGPERLENFYQFACFLGQDVAGVEVTKPDESLFEDDVNTSKGKADDEARVRAARAVQEWCEPLRTRWYPSL